ncbi:hypothetical protein L6164_028309 [Bauhinia variegata]|uniref:Uncharacterized protein n=1 Tax=Bauhinia variegata TaxID=167791 RepID=A0ACB9LX13_BAUVA|nr:hypothetical protein L6164_028309 [Bauhinia variegata]
MDEEVVVDAASLGVAEGAQHQSKEDDEYSLRPESCKMLTPQDILGPSEADYSQIPPQEYLNIGQGKNVVDTHVTTSEDPSQSLFLDDDGVMELTVSYNGSTLDIGTSNNREKMHNRQSHWLHLYHLAGDSGGGNSLSDTGYRNCGQATSSGREDIGSTFSPDLLPKKSLSDDQSNIMQHLTNAENKGCAGNVHGGIGTKMISKSGFSEYFVKNALKGKGRVCKGPTSDGSRVESRDQNQIKAGLDTQLDSIASPSIGSIPPYSSSCNTAVPRLGGSVCDGVTLREWLKPGGNKASKAECLYIYKNIVDLVDSFHFQGVALHNLCPSYIKLLPSNEVMYLGLPLQKQMIDNVVNSEALHLNNSSGRKRPSEQVTIPSHDIWSKKHKFNENARVTGVWSQFPPRSDLYPRTASDSEVNVIGSQNYYNESEEDIQISRLGIQRMTCFPRISNAGRLQLTSASGRMEDKWYTSPEGGCTILSNIYCLGVLLFELLGRFDSEGAHIAAMTDLHHRILPPVFLSENIKEAGFCLWLLHPEPSSRPTTREILQSEVISGLQEVYSEELSSSIDQDDAESELLLHFLLSLQEQKQKDASTLVEEIKCLESDIKEVERRHDSKKSSVSALQNESSYQNESEPLNKEPLRSETVPPISQLESAYFSMRSKIQLAETGSATHPDVDLLRNRENWHLAQKDEEKQKATDPLGIFFDGLCKYARYNKFEVRGVLRNADLNNPANVICSLNFDRDEDYFAAAGVSKKIKIFEYNALLNDSVDIHYPVVEMLNKSKLSCVCWNNYIKNYLASTDYDGVVKLWDASIGQGFSQFTGHEKRAWSVDFSPVYPTKFASGSDDCSVKLWSISEKNCLDTINNVANVCCVQFSAHSTHLLAFGSADYTTYCYDLRNVRAPWCVLVGHKKAVSHVKFLDSETLVSASTDNTLKIWDLKKTSSAGPSTSASTSACSLTLSGHTNEKNFVGLSVADGYIACGSETNEVYAYYRSLPMPIASHKFGSIDPISGKETNDDNGQFVSSVCWRRKSDSVIAANSSGWIKVLQMV